jgi:hypothetical protein
MFDVRRSSVSFSIRLDAHGQRRRSCETSRNSVLFRWNIVRFAHNWNIGTVGIEDQNEHNDIDFLVIIAYLLG